MVRTNDRTFFAGIAVGSVLGVAATLVLGRKVDDGALRQLRERGLRLRGGAGALAGRARTDTRHLIDLTRVAAPKQGARLKKAISEGKKAVARKQEEWRSKPVQPQQEPEGQD